MRRSNNGVALLLSFLGLTTRSCYATFAGDYSAQGFDHSWSAEDGWLYLPPDEDGSNEFFFDYLDTAEECAMTCEIVDAIGGAWNSRDELCWCYFKLVCREPCIREDGVEFSTRHPAEIPLCEKSFCDPVNQIFYDTPDYCASMSSDLASCDSFSGSVEIASNFQENTPIATYDHSWASSEGWFFLPPTENESDDLELVFDDIDSPQECGEICDKKDAIGGSWNEREKLCWCHFKLVCLEPCIKEQGIEFSRVPRSSFPVCRRSFCHSDYQAFYECADYCDGAAAELNSCSAITFAP